MDTKTAVEKMSCYLRFLADTRTRGLALHMKQATVDKLAELSRNLERSQSLVTAIAETYPEKTAIEQQKLYTSLSHCLYKRIKQAMGGSLGQATVGNVQMAPSVSKSAPIGPAGTGSAFTGM